MKSYALKTGSVCEQAEAFLVFQTVKAFLDFIASEPNTPRLQQALALWQALSSALQGAGFSESELSTFQSAGAVHTLVQRLEQFLLVGGKAYLKGLVHKTSAAAGLDKISKDLTAPLPQDLGKFIHSAQTCFSFTKKSLALDESSFEKDESVNGAQLQPYLSTYVKILGCGLEEVKELFAAQVADAEEFIQKFEGLMKRFVVLVSADIKAAKSALEPYRQWVY